MAHSRVAAGFPGDDRNLAEILVAKGVITEGQYLQALDLSRARLQDIGEAVFELGFAPEKFITMARAKSLKMQFFDFDRHKVDPDARKLVPIETCRLLGILPVLRQDGRLFIAMSDATRIRETLRPIRDLFADQLIEPVGVLATKLELEKAITQFIDGEADPPMDWAI